MMGLPIQSKLLEGSVAIVQREEILSCKGKKVVADPQPVDCLVLRGTNGSKFGVKIVTQDHPQARAVVLDKNRVVYIDMQDCRGRLLLEDDEQVDCELETYFRKKNLPSALNNYERLQVKNKTFDTSLLIRMVKVAFEYRSTSRTRGIHLSGIGALKVSLVGRCILAAFKGDKLTLVDITDKKMLWKGGESIVYTAPALPHGKEVIAKVYDRTAGVLKAQNELLFLEQLHLTCSGASAEHIPGILKPYLGVVEFDSEFYILQSKYKLGNLDDALKVESAFPTLDDKLMAFYRLLSSLHVCFTKAGFVHRDIKPLNILARIDKSSGKTLLDHADFGTALLCDPSKVELPSSNVGATPAFVLLKEVQLRTHLEGVLSKSADLEAWKSYIELMHKGDLFALGRTMAFFIVPGQKFDEYFWNPEPNSFKRRVLLNAGVPREVCDLIRNMLEADITKRYNSLAALRVLRAILKERGLSIPVDETLDSSLSAQELLQLSERGRPPSPEPLEIRDPHHTTLTLDEKKLSAIVLPSTDFSEWN